MEPTIEITAELLAGFLDEAGEHLAALNEHLMEFERQAEVAPINFTEQADRDRMTEMFRAAHSLKGLSATFGFTAINRLTHRMETLFDQARLGNRCFDSDTLETLLTGVGMLEALVQHCESPTDEPPDVSEVSDQLDQIMNTPYDADDTEAVDQSAETGSDEGTEVTGNVNELVGEVIDDEAARGPDFEIESDAEIDAHATQGFDELPESILHDPDLRKIFIETTEEAIDELNDKLLKLEAECNEDLLNDAFRVAHNLKGACGAAGLQDATRLTHKMESFFDSLRNGKTSLSDEMMTAFLSVADRLTEVVDMVKKDAYSPWPDEQIDTLFQAAAAGGSNSAAAAAAAEPVTGEATIDMVSTVVADSAANGVTDDAVAEHVEASASTNASSDAAGTDSADSTTATPATIDANVGTTSGNASIGDSDDGAESGATGVADDVSTPAELIASTDATVPSAASGANASEDAVEIRFNAPSHMLESAGCGYQIAIEFAPEPSTVDFQELLILNRLKTYGEVVWMHPNLDTGERGDASVVEFVLAMAANDKEQADSIENSLWPFEPARIHVRPFGDPSSYTRSSATNFALAEPEMPIVPAAKPAPKPKPVAAAAKVAKATPATAASASTETTKSMTSGKPAAASTPAAPKTAAPNTPADAASKPSTAAAAAPKNNAPARASGPVSTATIRVDVERLDQLMNLGGELVINRARFAQMAREFKTLFDGDLSYVADDLAVEITQIAEELKQVAGRDNGLNQLVDRVTSVGSNFHKVHDLIRHVHRTRPAMNSFGEAVNTLGRISEGLQKRIMDTRMVPVGPLFQRFNRLTRDIAKDLKKKINFVMYGENTELDKKMIDELADPLTHMVRNSADHGIESPEDRVNAGKPAAATITLSAYHQGNSICIQVKDDGRGIDLQRVRAKMIEREIATEVMVAQMTDHELVQYIFHPGFSTAQQVSDLSGRGMGMDIVKTKIQNLNGSIDVHTESGKGTTVTIRLPLTLAIISALQTRIGSEVYCLPLESVGEIVTYSRKNIRSIQGQCVARVRDSVIPVFMLEDVMEMSRPDLQTRCRDSDEWTIVIIGSGTARMGLVVDHMIGQEDVVIKSLAENFQNIAGFSGATIMGDGRVSLILDVGQLVNARGGSGADGGPDKGQRHVRPTPATVGA